MKGIIWMSITSLLFSSALFIALFVITSYAFDPPKTSAYANCQKRFPERVLVIESSFQD